MDAPIADLESNERQQRSSLRASTETSPRPRRSEPYHRRLDTQPLDLIEDSADSVGDGFGAYKMTERVRGQSRRWIRQRPDQHELLLVLVEIVIVVVGKAIAIDV